MAQHRRYHRVVKAINNKDKYTFLNFDIAEFYPSISKHLLDDAINWAKQYTDVTDYDIKIIKHARQSPVLQQQNLDKKECLRRIRCNHGKLRRRRDL